MRRFKKSSNINPVEKTVYVEWRPTDDADPRDYRIEAIRQHDGTYRTNIQELISVRIERSGKPEHISVWAPAKDMPRINCWSATDAIEQLLSAIDD